MTTAALLALAQRLLNHAAMHDSVVPNDDYLRQWRDELLEVARYLRQCAQAEPVAWLYATIAGTRITHYADKLDAKQLELDLEAAREYPKAHKVTPLYTHPQPQPQQAGVPEGWKLVPLEPTTEMVEAAFDAIPASLLDGNIRTHYRAMLAAAPKPPSAQEEVVEALRDALQRVLDTVRRGKDVHEREARRQALEDAACILDAVDNYANPLTSRDCADAIRALKEETK